MSDSKQAARYYTRKAFSNREYHYGLLHWMAESLEQIGQDPVYIKMIADSMAKPLKAR